MLQVGSIEGRVAVQHIDEAQQSKNFTFKCHRDNNDIYAVNSIDFHPVCSSLFSLLFISIQKWSRMYTLRSPIAFSPYFISYSYSENGFSTNAMPGN
jgi:hypothetical protein